MRSAVGRRGDEHDAPARREIDDVLFVVHDEPIGHELHAPSSERWPARSARTRPIEIIGNIAPRRLKEGKNFR